MVKIFVGGFPLDMTELELVQIISPYATVSTIKIVRDKKTRLCKGYAFLEVTDEAGANNAMDALNNTKLGDRILNVKPAQPPKPTPPPNPFRVKRPRRPM